MGVNKGSVITVTQTTPPSKNKTSKQTKTNKQKDTKRTPTKMPNKTEDWHTGAPF